MNVPKIEQKSVIEHAEGTPYSVHKNPRMMWLVLATVQRLQQNGTVYKSGVMNSLRERRLELATPTEAAWLADADGNTAHNLLNAARNHLFAYGLLAHRGKGWKATKLGSVISDEAELHYFTADEPEKQQTLTTWQEAVVARMTAMSPRRFEQLVARLLAKAGAFDVKVSKRGPDGGIDGTGSMIRGIDSPMVFQAKRYSEQSVSSALVRDFRGAVQGRALIGMFFTTSTFTKDAWAEADRTMQPTIKLFDGAAMAELAKDLRIGVIVEERTVEDIAIDEEWWDAMEAEDE